MKLDHPLFARKRLCAVVAVLALVAALAPSAAFAGEPLSVAAVSSGSAKLTTQATASPAYALLRNDGNLWRCTAQGKPVSKYWNGNTTLASQLNKVKTVFVASNVTSMKSTNYAWSRSRYSSGRTSDYRYSMSFSSTYLKNVKTVKFLTNSAGANNCKAIGEGAFSYAANITKVANLNKTKVTSIGKRAFSQSNVTSVSLPKTLKSIGDYAFYNCAKLTNVDGLNKTKVSKLGNHVFYSSKKLKSIALPSTCKVIGNYAFSDCVSLTSAKVGSETAKVGDRAFANCENLASIALPTTCKKLGYSAFSGCSKLKKVTMRSKSVVAHAANSSYSMSGQFYGTPIEVEGNGACIYVPSSVISEYRSSSYTNHWYSYRTKFKTI